MFKDIMPYIMLIFVVGIIYYTFNLNNVKVNEMNYNEFLTNLKGEKVKELTVTPKDSDSVYLITGKLENYSKNETFMLIVPYKDSVIDNILSISNEQQLDVKVNKDPGSVSWLVIILDFVPILLIGGLTIYLVRAMMGNGKGGTLDFGRSRAKLNQEGGKVTFKDVAGLNEEKEEVKELIDFLKSPKSPLSSSVISKLLSSTTRPDNISPTSPMSLVRTFFSAFSEKSAIFFWVPAPYCKIACELCRSIFCEKSSTIFFSSAVRLFSLNAESATISVSSATVLGNSCVSGVSPNVSVGVVVKSLNSSPMSLLLVLFIYDLFLC